MPHTQGDKARQKSVHALKTISEAAELIDVPQHVLRFWETKFPQIRPLKRNGGRRFYRPEDIDLLLKVKFLLYKQGYTIKGAKKAFEQKQVEDVMAAFSPIGQGQGSDYSNDNGNGNDNGPAPASVASEASLSGEGSPPGELHNVIASLKRLSGQLRERH